MKKPALSVRRPLVTDVGSLFDRRSMEAAGGGFRFRGRSVQPVGRPSIRQYQQALAFACEFYESSPWWIASLISYGEDRTDWAEKLDQAMSVTRLSRQTLLNLGYLYRHSTEETRALAPTPGHLDAVAALPEPEQRQWLDKARREEMPVRELRLEVRAAKRQKVIEGQAFPAGRFRVWLCDPPWLYGDRPPSGSGAKEHYPAMTIEDLCALPVQEHLTKDAVLFLWVTAPILLQNPGPREVIEAWGFEPKTGMVWHKRRHNFGHYVSIRHEHVIIATRGSCTPDRPTPMPDSVFTSAQDRFEHSEKPEELRRVIERLYDGPRMELFARRPSDEEWTCWGNDPATWAVAQIAP